MTHIVNAIGLKYRNHRHPAGFGGADKAVRHYNFDLPPAERKILPKSAAAYALTKIDTYTLWKQRRRPKVWNPIFVYKLRDLLQADLLDVEKLSSYNGGIKFLFVLVDSFSRKQRTRVFYFIR